MDKSDVSKLISEAMEPVYDLSDYVSTLSGSQEKKFWKIIEDLAFHGIISERFVCLAVISLKNKRLSKKIVDILVKEISTDYFGKREIISPVLSMVTDAKRTDLIHFCLDVLNKFDKDETDKEKLSYQAFNCLLELDWREVENQILEIIENEDDIGVTDTVAFFLYLHGQGEFESLLQSLEERLKKRIEKLMPEIEDRLNNHYMWLKKLG